MTNINPQQQINVGIFPCSSVKFKAFLLKKGLEYFNVSVDENNWTIWLFAKTPMFNKALKEWMNAKNNK